MLVFYPAIIILWYCCLKLHKKVSFHLLCHYVEHCLICSWRMILLFLVVIFCCFCKNLYYFNYHIYLFSSLSVGSYQSVYSNCSLWSHKNLQYVCNVFLCKWKYFSIYHLFESVLPYLYIYEWILDSICNFTEQWKTTYGWVEFAVSG